MSMFIIDDSNFEVHMNSDDPRCGCFARMVPYGQLMCAPASAKPRIPMEHWPDAIADNDRNHAWAKDIWADSPIGVLTQKQIGYCHAFSAVEAAMIKRHEMGLPYIELSPSSVGAPITGYQNQGAVITDDLQQMVNVGIASTKFVPTLTTRREDFKDGWEEDAANNKVLLFEELDPRDFEEHGTALIMGDVACVALNYWGHAVADVRLVDLYRNLAATNPFRYGVEFLNSWDRTWGDGGFGVRAQSKAPADQLYIPRQIKPTAPSTTRPKHSAAA